MMADTDSVVDRLEGRPHGYMHRSNFRYLYILGARSRLDMTSIEDAITYPMESDDWIVTVLIGGVLSLLSVLIVPMFLVAGYVVRAIRANLEGEPEPPAFGDWGELFVEGLKAVVIGFIYMLIPFIVMGFTVGTAMMAMVTGGEAGAAAGLGGLMVGMLVSFVLFVAFGYLSAVALVNFAREERFGAAFDFGVVRDVAFDGDFAVAYLISIAVFIAAGLVNVVPIVGALIAVFANFYAAIVAANLWADGFTTALDADEPSGSADVGEPIA